MQAHFCSKPLVTVPHLHPHFPFSFILSPPPTWPPLTIFSHLPSWVPKLRLPSCWHFEPDFCSSGVCAVHYRLLGSLLDLSPVESSSAHSHWRQQDASWYCQMFHGGGSKISPDGESSFRAWCCLLHQMTE